MIRSLSKLARRRATETTFYRMPSVFSKSEIEVIVTNDVSTIDEWILHYVYNAPSNIRNANTNSNLYVGLDAEWGGASKNWRGMNQPCLSLLQISANSSKSTLLIRTHNFPKKSSTPVPVPVDSTLIPKQLIRMIHDESVTKAGVEVQGDIKKLFQDYDFASTSSRSVHDIGFTAGRYFGGWWDTSTSTVDSTDDGGECLFTVGNGNGFYNPKNQTQNKLLEVGNQGPERQYPNFGNKVSLARCVKKALKTDVSFFKVKSVQRSNWDAEKLSDSQVNYAALDAILSNAVYEFMENNDLTALETKPKYDSETKKGKIDFKTIELFGKLAREGKFKQLATCARIATESNNMLNLLKTTFLKERNVVAHLVNHVQNRNVATAASPPTTESQTLLKNFLKQAAEVKVGKNEYKKFENWLNENEKNLKLNDVINNRLCDKVYEGLVKGELLKFGEGGEGRKTKKPTSTTTNFRSTLLTNTDSLPTRTLRLKRGDGFIFVSVLKFANGLEYEGMASTKSNSLNNAAGVALVDLASDKELLQNYYLAGLYNAFRVCYNY